MLNCCQELSSGGNKAFLRSHLRWLKSHSNFQSLHRDSPKSTDWIFFFFFPRREIQFIAGAGAKKLSWCVITWQFRSFPRQKCVFSVLSFSILQPLLPHMLRLIDWQMPSDFQSSRHSSSESRHEKKSCENVEEVRRNVVCEKLWTRYRFRQSNRVCFRFFHHLTNQFNKTLFFLLVHEVLI